MYNNNRTSIFGYNWWPEEVTFTPIIFANQRRTIKLPSNAIKTESLKKWAYKSDSFPLNLYISFSVVYNYCCTCFPGTGHQKQSANSEKYLVWAS